MLYGTPEHKQLYYLQCFEVFSMILKEGCPRDPRLGFVESQVCLIVYIYMHNNVDAFLDCYDFWCHVLVPSPP